MGSLPVDEVLRTEWLHTRPQRPVDHAAEARALSLLGETLATEPRALLQRVVDVVMEVCRADSAGVSILEPDGVFRWYALAGTWAPNLMGTVPRDASPCGVVIERDRPLLFVRPERHFDLLASADPVVEEVLNVPFRVNGVPAGTLWAVTHSSERRFDAEDERLLTSLSRFAAAGWQLMRSYEGRLDSALRAAKMASWEWDPSTGRVIADHGLSELLGLRPGESVTTVRQMLAVLLPEDAEAHRARLESGVAFRCELRIVRPRDGAMVWLEERAHQTRDARGNVIMSALVWDISERKLAEHDLREAERRKDEFIAALSHELRNPLGTIASAGRVLLQPSLPVDESARAAQLIVRQASTIGRLLEDLLESTRMTLDQLVIRKERVTLSATVAAALEASQTVLHSARHAISVVIRPQLLVCMADPLRLGQVIANLLTNAAKYTASGGRISLDVHHDPTRDEVVVSITDNGIGMDAEMVARAFDLPDARGGAGIGLALARRIVELHGGWIRAESEGAGRGSRFTFGIPRGNLADSRR